MKTAPLTIEVPRQDRVVDEAGIITRTWETFFRNARKILDSLGQEKCFDLVNNQSSEADIEGLLFSYRGVSQVAVDYLIQRVTTSTGANELIETGTFYLAYLPTSDDWELTGGPSTAGVTLSVTPTGQVQYTSSNITGTASISKITWRARTLAAKNSYSEVGR